MIDLISIINTANSLGKSMSSIYEYLTTKSKTKNIEKKFVFRELKNNLERLENRNKENLKLDKLIISLENEAYKKALKVDFDFNALAGKKDAVVTNEILIVKRNNRYIGWNCERLISNIDSKIEVLKDIVSYYDDINNSNTNFKLKLSNLYFQILLLVLLINQSNKK